MAAGRFVGGARAATSLRRRRRVAASGVRALEVVSNRADLVSGGDALVAATLARATPRRARGRRRRRRHERVRRAPNGRFEGVVSGLKLGAQHADRALRDGGGKRITITNHPIGGPVFAGPQVTPYACNPNASKPPLGPALDAQCNAPTRVELLYRNAANQFVAYDPANPPRRVQTTTTDAGRTVPFIVERVTGTVDRGIFQMAVLVDPAKPVTPWSTDQPWSRKLFYTFGGACGTEHRQLAPRQRAAGGAARRRLRRRHLEPEHLRQQLQRRRLGRGGDDDQGARRSSATASSLHDRQRRLGGLDAAAPAGRELPRAPRRPDHQPGVRGPLDAGAGLARLPRADALLLADEPAALPGHTTAPPNALFPTPASRQPVWGSNPTNPDNLCGQKVLLFGADRTELVPTANVACGLHAAQLWHPTTNPTGERCGIADFMRAVFGVTVTPDAPNGKGRLAVDNVGVQYGLLALQRGEITPEQFADLNAKVGGIDIDGNFIAAAHRRRSRTRCGSPTRPAGSTAARAPPTSRRSTTAPAARATTPASTRRSTRSPTARGWTGPTATTTTR